MTSHFTSLGNSRSFSICSQLFLLMFPFLYSALTRCIHGYWGMRQAHKHLLNQWDQAIAATLESNPIGRGRLQVQKLSGSLHSWAWQHWALLCILSTSPHLAFLILTVCPGGGSQMICSICHFCDTTNMTSQNKEMEMISTTGLSQAGTSSSTPLLLSAFASAFYAFTDCSPSSSNSQSCGA